MKVGSAPTTPKINPNPQSIAKGGPDKGLGPVPMGNAPGQPKQKGGTVAKKRPGKERKRQSR